jgi:hypothetical protein
MDVTYLILFINFFLQAYVLRGGKTKYKGVDGKNGASANGVHRQNGVAVNGKKHD